MADGTGDGEAGTHRHGGTQRGGAVHELNGSSRVERGHAGHEDRRDASEGGVGGATVSVVVVALALTR